MGSTIGSMKLGPVRRRRLTPLMLWAALTVSASTSQDAIAQPAAVDPSRPTLQIGPEPSGPVPQVNRSPASPSNTSSVPRSAPSAQPPGDTSESYTGKVRFPELTGRVVDAANIIDPAAEQKISAKLAAYEAKTSDQVVVATVPSLDGLTIEDYANRLYRHWQLGTKKNNNGVLFIVAPSQRKVRIEVGYGLEGALTDALSKVIITTAVAPRFKQGDFSGGIEAGVDAIINILSGDAEEWQRRADPPREEASDTEELVHAFIYILVMLVIFWIISRRGGGGGSGMHRRTNGNWGPVIIPPIGGGFGGGFGGGGGGGFGGGGGGFSGGGGSSGGGGASGDW